MEGGEGRGRRERGRREGEKQAIVKGKEEVLASAYVYERMSCQFYFECVIAYM